METKITYEVKANGKHLTLIIIPLIENDDSEEIPQSVYSEKWRLEPWGTPVVNRSTEQEESTEPGKSSQGNRRIAKMLEWSPDF